MKLMNIIFSWMFIIQCMLLVLCEGVSWLNIWRSRFVLDGFPKTLKQAELMGSSSIIPMIVFELELDTVEVLKRGLADKTMPNKSENAL